MTLPDFLRVFVLFCGGVVVGAAWPILLMRASFYRRLDLPSGVRGMYLLGLMNTVVLTFVALVMLSHWGEPLTWRWAVAATIFALKAAFFRELRCMTLAGERDAVRFGPQPH